MTSIQSIRASETLPTISYASCEASMPASASACALSTHRRNVIYDHRRSESVASSASSSSSTSTAAGLQPRGKSATRANGVSPSGSRHHAAILAAANLAAKRATKNGRAPTSTTSSVCTTSSSSAASTSATLPSIPSIIMSNVSEPRPVIFEEEYQEEVVAHMREMESQTLANLELMNAQPELRWFMRPYLVDFIVEIHQTFRLRPETLYLAMNIVDRYVSKRIVFKRHYQLVGSAALLIAAKYEDAKDRVPTVADLSSMCCQAYDESAFIQMEGHILQTLSWQLGFPTPEAWLRQMCMQSSEEAKTQSVARFLMEDTLFHRDFIGIRPSLLAAGSLMLARYICKVDTPRELENVDEVSSVAQLIDAHISQNLQDLSLILIKKYSYQHFFAASTVVRSFYLTELAAAAKASDKEAATTTLLPAHSLHSSNVQASTSTDSCDDADCSMSSSGTSTPSSMASTPSRSTFGDVDEDEDDEDDDDDMPVTPLSLTALHDPLASAAAAAALNHNGSASPRSKSTKSQSYQHSYLTVDTHQQHGAKSAAVFPAPASATMTADPMAKTSATFSKIPASLQQQQQHAQPQRSMRPVLAVRRNSNVSWQH